MVEKHSVSYPQNDWEYQRRVESKEEAYEQGRGYFYEWLQPVLPGLTEMVEEMQDYYGYEKDEVACLFLDRDSRGAMHGWNALMGPEKYDTYPVPMAIIQYEDLLDPWRYLDYGRQDSGLPLKPYEWSRQVREMVDTRIVRHPEIEDLVSSYRTTLSNRLENKKLVFCIDIGYRGSAAEIGSALLGKAFDDKFMVIPMLLYKQSKDIPTRGVVVSTDTFNSEVDLPHSVTGYSIHYEDDLETGNPVPGKYHYERDPVVGGPAYHGNTEFEQAFYKGIIASATAMRERNS